MSKVEFPTTRWSTINAAIGDDPAAAAKALQRFCRKYQGPLRNFVLKLGDSHERADELLQEFFKGIVEDREVLKGFQQHRAREDGARERQGKRPSFHGWMIACLSKLRIDEYRRQKAQKRAGQAGSVFLDVDDAQRLYPDELNNAKSAADLFERECAYELIDRACQRIKSGFQKRGDEQTFDCLAAYLRRREKPERVGEEIAKELGIKPDAARQRFGRFLESLREAIDDEIREIPGENVEEYRKYVFSVLTTPR